ncbi:MAG: HIG1 domain-containing protein [Rhodospirillales bacterium]
MAIAANIIIGIALLVTAGVLAAGLISMGFEGSINEKYSNLLMRSRVVAQGAAVALMALAALLLNL